MTMEALIATRAQALPAMACGRCGQSFIQPNPRAWACQPCTAEGPVTGRPTRILRALEIMASMRTIT